ncbi:MAG: YceD family protein [Dehalococcoidia bacterium]
MQFVVGQQLREPVGGVTHYDIRKSEAFPQGEDSVSELTGSVDLMRTDQGILVSAVLHCTIAANCSRCLTPISYSLTITFQEEYLPTVDASTGEPLPLPSDPDVFLIDSHQVLDLTEAVRQYRLTAEPMQPLCKPDCLGLCPHCGYNLNQGPCGCPGEETDARWAALKGLAISIEEEQES